MAERVSAVQRFIRVVLGPNAQLDKMPEYPDHDLWFQMLKARLADIKACEEWLIWRRLGDMRFLKGAPTGNSEHDHHGMNQDEMDMPSRFLLENYNFQGFYHLVPEQTELERDKESLRFWGISRAGSFWLGYTRFNVAARQGSDYWIARLLTLTAIQPEEISTMLGVSAKKMFLALGEDIRWVLKRRQELLEQTAAVADAMEAENAVLLAGTEGERWTT